MKEAQQVIGHRLLGNLISGWGAIALRGVITFLLVPFLLGRMGREGYGLTGLLTVIVAWSSVADLGLRSALGRELSEKVAKNDMQGFRVLSSSALVLYLVIALMMSSVGWILAPWLIDLFKVGGELKVKGIWLLRVFGSLSVLMAFMIPVMTAGLTSFMRFDVVNMVEGARAIGTGLALFLVLSSVDSDPLIWWAVIVSSGTCLSFLALYLLYRRLCYGGRLGVRFLDRSELSPLFRLGGYMYALQMIGNLTERANPLIVSSFLGPAGVALYQSGAKVSQMLRPAVMTFVNQMHPLATRCHVLQQNDRQQRLFLDGTRYTFMLGSFVSAGVLIFAEPFCRLWLGESMGDDYRIVAEVMRLIAIVDMLVYAKGTQWPILLGMKRLKLLVWVLCPSAVLNIIVSIYLVGFTSLGLGSVVYATIVINGFLLPVTTLYVSKCVSVTLHDCFLRSYLRPLVCLAMTTGCCGLIVRHVECGTWVSLMGAVAMGSVFWLISVVVVGVTSKEREMFLGLVVKAAGKVVTSRRS